MDNSFRLLSSMSPMVAPNAKRKLLKNKVPRKLALKKNVRRSSLLDGLPPTLQNNSLVIIDSSLENIESPIVPKSRKNELVQSTAEFNNQLSVTRYAEINNWVTEVNLANNILSDEECETIIQKFVTERRKRNDLKIDIDSVAFSSNTAGTDDHSESNKDLSEKHKEESCIIIASSSDNGSVESYKSAHSDVVVIESSFKYSESDYTIDKNDLIQTEPRKKKPVVKITDPSRTEGKVLPRNQQGDSEPLWLQRLKELCDSDTTNSSLKVDLFNASSNRDAATKGIHNHGRLLKSQLVPNQELTTKQVRKKLSFTEIINSLTNNKENCNNLINKKNINEALTENNKDNNCDNFPKETTKPHKKNLFLDVCDKKETKNTKSITTSNGFSTRNRKKESNKNKEEENSTLDNKCKSFQNTYRDKNVSDLSSEEETLENRLYKNTIFDNKHKESLRINKDSELIYKKIDSDKEFKNLEANSSFNDKYFSDISSDYEPLEERLRKKNINLDSIFKSKTHVLEGKNIQENKRIEKAPKRRPKKDKGDLKVIKSKNDEVGTQAGLCADGDHKSFLASLSGCVKQSQCHPSARIFRNNFQTYKSQLTTRLFKIYNESVFDNAIPDDSPIEWSDRMRGTAGYCYCRKIVRSTGALEKKIRIVLSSKVLDSADRLRDTLIHELCHAATWIVNGVANGHGDHWRAWTLKARKVFPELPPINRCHDYVINTKYTYRCINCGYSFGRHSKSLDLNAKRCGYCLSRFELLVNKKSKDGELKSVPATPKKEPTGFALFVKENYGKVRTPQLNHGQVMKLLGQKFNELKI